MLEWCIASGISLFEMTLPLMLHLQAELWSVFLGMVRGLFLLMLWKVLLLLFPLLFVSVHEKNQHCSSKNLFFGSAITNYST